MSDREKLVADVGIVVCLLIAAIAFGFAFADCALKQACLEDDGALDQVDCYSVIPCKECPPSTLCDWRCLR